MSIFDFFPKATPSPPPVPKLAKSPANDPYLPAFRVMLATARTLLGSGAVVDRFERLSEAAQVLYMRLFNRKGYWYYLADLEYGDVQAASAELVSAEFAVLPAVAFQGPPERLYELLRSLRRPDLEDLVKRAKALLVQLTGEDHSSTPLPSFPRPEKNPLYVLARHLSTAQLSQSLRTLQTATVWTLSEPKPKALVTALLMELLGEIQTQVEGVRAAWKLAKRKEGRGWVEVIVSEGFPAVVGLTINEKTEIMRILAAFDFFHTQNEQNYLEYIRITGAKFPAYTCNPSDFPLFPDFNSNVLLFDANLVENMLKFLPKYHLSKELQSQIALTISNFSLTIFAADNIGPIPSFPAFLSNYQGQTATLSWIYEFSPQWRWARVAHQCVSFLEKALLWPEAISLYCNLLVRPYYYQRRGLWWERLLLDLFRHVNDKESAKIVAQMALSDPWVRTGKRITIEKQAFRLGFTPTSLLPTTDSYFSQYSHPNFHLRTICASSREGETGPLYVTEQDRAVKVEEYALWWYGMKGWKGFHCENALFRALYAIFLWPVLYSSLVPDTFLHNYQKSALDYKSFSFYTSRKDQFAQEFANLQDCADLVGLFTERYTLYQGHLSAYIDWDMAAGWGVGSLREIVGVIDRKALIGVFGVLAQDYKYTNHGLPDLLLWTDSQVQLVEVKSHNDRLADHQKLWIQTLAELGLQVEVLHVLNA